MDTVVDDIPCYSVAARYPKTSGVDMELVIEKDALLIRRIKTLGEPSRFSATELRDSINASSWILRRLFS